MGPPVLGDAAGLDAPEGQRRSVVFLGSERLLPPVVRRVMARGGRSDSTTRTDSVGRFAPAAGAERPRAAVDRRVPYGERPARNRQLTLLAELLGQSWRRELPVRFGLEAGELTRRQAAAAIRRLTGGVRPAHVARSTWHRVAVDPDWIDRPRGSRRRAPGWTTPPTTAAASAPESAAGGVLPIQVKALRLLGDRLGLDIMAAAPARFGCELSRLDRRHAAAWIAELTQQVLLAPEGAPVS